jgi:ParB family chromosome partitioning protein
MTPSDEKRRGLGRGLNALFGDEETSNALMGSGVQVSQALAPNAPPPPQIVPNNVAPSESNGRRMIGVAQISPGTYQPRHIFRDESLQELASSIREHGLIQPILVRPKPNDPTSYEIVAGERRWRAAQIAMLHEVPVIIRELTDDVTLEIALIENLQREDLNPMDESRALKQLADEFDYGLDDVAKKVGKSKSYVANMLRLSDVHPEVANMIEEVKLGAGHARALLTLPKAAQIELATKIVQQGYSVRQAEKLAAQAKGTPIKHRVDKLATKIKNGAVEKDVNTAALEREISNMIGMSVTIDMINPQEGRMGIYFKTLDQLDDVLQRLSHTPSRLTPRQ